MNDRVANPPDAARLAELLKVNFGHEAFRPMQADIVADALAGRDVLVVMPTGGGKSLCYQLPAVAGEGVTLVVSPLIALMQDQVHALLANGVEATVLNSSVTAAEIAQRERDALAGQYRLIYMAPERLMGGAGQRLLERLPVSRIAIDEAHCISEWGHDFRPEYRMLGQLRRRFPQTPIMALTATATPRVADDIVEQLNLRDPGIYRAGFERKNLFYDVRPKKQVARTIIEYVHSHGDDEGIVYCLSRNGAERMAAELQQAGIAALPYHAGLDHAVRAKNQHDFVYGETRVICATIAFGMGIDKPDVRFVFHADLPRNLEGYYQETGRAGRDGLPADCILFFSAGDRMKLERFIEEKQSEKERQLAYWQLQQVIEYAYTTECRCIPLLGYFGERHHGSCGHCDNCKRPPKMIDVTQDARKLLSAVARTDQRFGLRHVVSVLRGDDNEKITRHGHDQLSVYGIGGGETVRYWRRVAEALSHNGQLGFTADEFRTTYLTEASLPVLRGQEKVHLVQSRVESAPKGKRARATSAAVGRESDDANFDQVLFDRLRDLRRDIAEQQNVPPYVVFGDVSLRQMAARKPTTEAQFAAITGVGQYKLTHYGETFLQAIREYVGA